MLSMKKKTFTIFLKDRPILILVAGTKAEYVIGNKLTIHDGEEEVASFRSEEVQGWKSEEKSS
jgi:hypothetical protein